jgi:hypothetical protein
MKIVTVVNRKACVTSWEDVGTPTDANSTIRLRPTQATIRVRPTQATI